MQAVIEPLKVQMVSQTMARLIKTCDVLIRQLQYAHFYANKSS